MYSASQDAINSTFADVELLVYDTVHRFIEKHGGTFDEWIGDAHEAFMSAYESYTPGKSSFSYHVRYRVYKRLQEMYRRRMMRHNRLAQVDADVSLFSSREFAVFDLDEFLGRLSDEAAEVVRLVFEPTMDIRLSLHQLGVEEPRTIRAALREYLDDMGWSRERVRTTFTEIATALSS